MNYKQFKDGRREAPPIFELIRIDAIGYFCRASGPIKTTKPIESPIA
jgi:hypothetical protein